MTRLQVQLANQPDSHLLLAMMVLAVSVEKLYHSNAACDAGHVFIVDVNYFPSYRDASASADWLTQPVKLRIQQHRRL